MIRVFVWIFSFFLSASSFANGCIPPRLLHDLVINDTVHFALEQESVLGDEVKSMGFDGFDEYSYSQDSYSKAIVLIKDNSASIGKTYDNSLLDIVSENDGVIEKMMMKAIEKCGKDELKRTFVLKMHSVLSGKDRKVELSLTQVNLRAISDSVAKL